MSCSWRQNQRSQNMIFSKLYHFCTESQPDNKYHMCAFFLPPPLHFPPLLLISQLFFTTLLLCLCLRFNFHCEQIISSISDEQHHTKQFELKAISSLLKCLLFLQDTWICLSGEQLIWHVSQSESNLNVCLWDTINIQSFIFFNRYPAVHGSSFPTSAICKRSHWETEPESHCRPQSVMLSGCWGNNRKELLQKMSLLDGWLKKKKNNIKG